MLKLNINQEREIKFEVQIEGEGIQTDQVSTFLRLEVDGVEYGFSGKIINNSVCVRVPPLKNIIPKKLSEGREVDTKLEVIVDESIYFKFFESTEVQ